MPVVRPSRPGLTCSDEPSSRFFLTLLKSSSSLFRMAEKTGKLKRHNGSAIRAFRVKDGKKPGQFASEAVISYSTLDNIENERKEASVEVLYRIAGVLNVPVEAIVRDPITLLASNSVEAKSEAVAS